MDIHTYRGWRSTRLHLALIAMALISAGFAAIGFKPDQFSAFCMSLLGAAGIYSGTATADRFAAKPPSGPEGPPATPGSPVA